ncbi:MAG: lipopolysaccharide heptosyltransferase I, partial [Pseudomonadota bacterium]|nr:lipopolysaccharide heptosyltransferase I [Pseudomonadota bacterium]
LGMRILIVKLSSLGDVVHALPVVADLRAAMPQATLDWVVEPAFAPLLQRVEGVAEIIEAPLRSWARRGWLAPQTWSEMRAFASRLRRERYQAVFDLQGLTKAAVIAALARGPSWGLANQTEGASHEWPARALVDYPVRVEPHVHALDRSRLLVGRGLDMPLLERPCFGLVGWPLLDVGQSAKRAVVLIHGSSRRDKMWPEASWVEIGRRLRAAGQRIALPQSSDEEGERARRICNAIGDACEVWPAMDLGALVDRMAVTAGVIGVDSGPSHIAVALGLPHVQIYNFPTAWRTGPQPLHAGPHQVAVGTGDSLPSVDVVWAAWQAVNAP